ncbi:MAG TPA: thiamine pyrophosphate-dependent enzyme [Micropepsaceae bacterium]|jgi:thiamine pyrophosphate-dependent acetolactate synthase large subunit-like protein
MAPNGRNTRPMNRFDLTARLVSKLKHDEAVIGGIGNSNFDLWHAGHRPQNFYMLGSMGLATPIALGVALAQPQRRVFALEGDGSLLMQLGALATIANLSPRNLTIIVWDNAMYQITGAQPTATAGRADLVEIARAAGIVQSAWANDEDEFDRLSLRTLSEDGPWFIGARIDGQSPVKQTPREPVIIKNNFMRGLGVQPPSKS